MGISIHSECLIYDLRCVLSLLAEHNTTVGVSRETEQSERLIRHLVEAIEDAESFIRGLEAAINSGSPQAGMGPANEH